MNESEVVVSGQVDTVHMGVYSKWPPIDVATFITTLKDEQDVRDKINGSR